MATSSQSTKVKDLQLLLLGNMNVGKTSLIDRYCNHKFDEAARATVGIDWSKHEHVCPDGTLA